MITYDDNITLVSRSGESRSYGRTDRGHGLWDSFVEPRAREWLRRTDDAMFANYYAPCIDR